MNKFKNTFEKLSIKATPGKYKALKDTCIKLQAIIDRYVMNEKLGIVPTYKQELDFYKIFIPNIAQEMKEHIGRTDRLYIIRDKVNKWAKAQLPICNKYNNVFNKRHLTNIMPTLGSASVPKKKSPPKRRSTVKKPKKTSSIRKSSL